MQPFKIRVKWGSKVKNRVKFLHIFPFFAFFRQIFASKKSEPLKNKGEMAKMGEDPRIFSMHQPPYIESGFFCKLSVSYTVYPFVCDGAVLTDHLTADIVSLIQFAHFTDRPASHKRVVDNIALVAPREYVVACQFFRENRRVLVCYFVGR